MSGIADQVAVWGVGTSHFGRFPGRRVEDLAWDAIAEALDDAGVEPAQVDAIVVGSVFGAVGVASRVARAAGLVGVPNMRVEAACASGTIAVHEAIEAVASGRYGCVLAIGIEQLSTTFSGPIAPEPTDADGALGLPMPALYALQAQRYVHRHRRDPDELATVAVKNRRHGAQNSRAHWHQEVTLDDVLGSRPIAEPLTLLQCCPMSDGAGAAVVGRQRGDDVAVIGSAVVGGRGWPAGDDEPWGVASVRRVAEALRATTGFEAQSADVFEVHDAFTIGEVLTVEALGLCPAGSALDELAGGEFTHGGRWVVNPSGGLLSRGHALGATGLAQTAEVVWQLRGTASDRQVSGAAVGVVETMGGGAAGLDGNVAAMVALRV